MLEVDVGIDQPGEDHPLFEIEFFSLVPDFPEQLGSLSDLDNSFTLNQQRGGRRKITVESIYSSVGQNLHLRFHSSPVHEKVDMAGKS